MKMRVFLVNHIFKLIGVALIITSCSNNQIKVTLDKISVDAPFDMPVIEIPDFSKCKNFLITDYGAIQGDKEKTSLAINSAIRDANKAGGGNVIVPEGEWLTKMVHLKSNVNIHIRKGATLLFSENPNDYLPAVHTSWEGMECYNFSPLIYAYQCKNIAITGEGKLIAKLDVWEIWYKRSRAHMNSLKNLYNMASYNVPVIERQMVNDTSNFRPHFIQFNRCENILLEGVSIINSPFWTIHPYLSKNVVLRKLTVWAHGHNSDGVDPEMSQNVLIEDCIFDQGDDAIAVKSGRNQDAWRLNTPCKNVVIRNCHVKNGHQLLAVGSELSGGIENILIENCTVEQNAKMFHLVFIKTNERRGGYVKNIYAKNIKAGNISKGILGIETDVLYQWRNLVPTIERRLTPVSDVYLDNIKAKDMQFISRIMGQEELPVNNIFLKNITVNSLHEQQHIHENVFGFKLE